MTETATDTDESNGTDDGPTGLSLPDGAGYEQMTTYLFWGAFALLSILAVVATVGLYTSVSSVIDVWIAPDYQPVFRAAFNLVVVLASVIGLSLLVRRLDGTDRL